MRVYLALTMLYPLLSAQQGTTQKSLASGQQSSLNYKKRKKFKKFNVSHYVVVYSHNLISKCRTNEACARFHLLAPS